MKKITCLSIVSLLFCTQVYASPKVIYGEDNRRDVFESTDSVLVELSRSTAAMINQSNLKKLARGETQIIASSLQSRGICAKERFSQQPSAANCSGFLVSPNLLVTAGHCIKNDNDCSTFKWVFDYKVDHTEQKEIFVRNTAVYGCKKIISRSLDILTKDDYALIELDRRVRGRAPLAFRKQGKISPGEEVVVIGHPTGLPTKIADGAKVRTLARKFFVANLDTYGGNSGSAVFNLKTSEVEGILVRGENDYVHNSTLGCKVSNICSENGCRGEDVTFIGNIPELKNL